MPTKNNVTAYILLTLHITNATTTRAMVLCFNSTFFCFMHASIVTYQKINFAGATNVCNVHRRMQK